MVSLASSSSTEAPACCSVMAAASPLGPEPTTTASKSLLSKVLVSLGECSGFLRQRSRPTLSERALHASAMAFHVGDEPVKIRRMLERPVGSVRWKDDTPDRAQTEVVAIPTSTGSGV